MSEETAFEDLEFEEGVPAFELGLDVAAEGGSYRTRNNPAAPRQRTNITERPGAIDIRCFGADVVHGYLKAGEDAATLIVYEFQFDVRRRARRILTVDVEFRYAAADSTRPQPEVLAIAPFKRMTLEPTTQSETVTKGGEAKAGGNVMGAELGGTWKWEKAVTQQTHDATAILGFIDLKGRSYGASNAVSWTLLQNESMQTGVPSHVRTAVLLKRADDGEFSSTFKIKAKVDLVSAMGRLLSGATPDDDPILYDPSLPPTNKLRTYDTDNLGDVNLLELSTAAFSNNPAKPVWS